MAGEEPVAETSARGSKRSRYADGALVENAVAGPSHPPKRRRGSSNPFAPSSEPEDANNEAESPVRRDKGKGRAIEDSLPPSSPFRSSSPLQLIPDKGKGMARELHTPHSSPLPRSSPPPPPKHDKGKGRAKDSDFDQPPHSFYFPPALHPVPSLKRSRDDFEGGEPAEEDEDAMQTDDDDGAGYDPDSDENEPLPPAKRARLHSPDFEPSDFRLRKAIWPSETTPTDRNATLSAGDPCHIQNVHTMQNGDRLVGLADGAVTHTFIPVGIREHGRVFFERSLPQNLEAAEAHHVDGGNYSLTDVERAKAVERKEREDAQSPHFQAHWRMH